ncbi:MAG: SCO family protein [Candidatus Entotheonellia bacterium]
MRQTISRWVAVLWCVMAAPAVLGSAQFAGQALVPPPPPMDFTLTASDGFEFRLSHHRGKVVLLSFGYTFCPDVCPTTLVDLSQVRARLGEAAKRVQVAFITLDPERDGPERLGIYTKAFDPTFIGLTGSEEHLAQVRRMYGVIAEKEVVPGTSAEYLIAHSADTYVIDPEGRLRLLFPFGMSVEEMADDILQLMRR